MTLDLRRSGPLGDGGGLLDDLEGMGEGGSSLFLCGLGWGH